MTTIINAVSGSGLTQTADGSGIIKVQSNGVATNALAWVNFNGTGTVAIRSSYNVSSITDNGTGDYTVNFTNALSDANYAVSANNSPNFAGAFSCGPALFSNGTPTETAPTTSAARVFFGNTAGSAYDPKYVCISVFGN